MRVIVAEPSRIGRTIVASLLNEAGYEAVGCESAEAALALLRADATFDLLITSIEFTGMSGLELCWEARLLAEQRSPLQIVVLSSSHDEARLVEALDSGADDYLTKPPKKSEFLARLRASTRLLQAQRELYRLATFDSLTGLWNRRAFFEEISRWETRAGAQSFAMLDIDYFKQVNDRHGHDSGDAVLAEMGRRLKARHPGFARLGGEEFAILLDRPAFEAAQFAEELRRCVEAEPFDTPSGSLKVTVSIGVAERQAGAPLDRAMKDADIALYASKSAGRNRVTVTSSGGGVVRNETLARDAA